MRIIYIKVINKKIIEVYNENMNLIITFHNRHDYHQWVRHNCYDCTRKIYPRFDENENNKTKTKTN